MISLGELEKFFVDNSQLPDDDNKAFVISYQVEYDDPAYFRFFISSKTLLKLAINVEHIHADATYKLIWQGFPVLVIGTTDRTRQFHTFGVAVCSNEQKEDFVFLFNAVKIGTEKVFGEKIFPTTLICDAAHSIQNAFRQVFGLDALIIMCWAHMKKNTQKKVEKLVRPKEEVPKILNDIDLLQLSKSESIFDKASEMFVLKWKKQDEFMKYFQREWLDCNRNWFEGIKILIPSTNNALEAWNRVIKDENTLRERLSLSRFTVILTQYIETWSNHYVSNIKQFHAEPIINLDLWTRSYQWAKQNKTICSQVTSDSHIYTIPSKDEIATDKNRKTDFDTFDDFKVVMFSAWTTTLPKDENNWIHGLCDCPSFFKKMICKHVVGLAIRLKFAFPPPEAKTIPIGEKRRRSRPTKAKRALLIQ